MANLETESGRAIVQNLRAGAIRGSVLAGYENLRRLGYTPYIGTEGPRTPRAALADRQRPFNRGR
jgi:hypothetical protein